MFLEVCVMKKFSWTIFALLLCGFLPTVSNGQLITIGIEATVDYLHDANNLLEGKVHIGSIITGTYTYDTSTLDTNPAADIGDYFHYNTPCGVVLNLEGFIFTTDFNNVNFLAEMINNYQGQPRDNYLIGSSNNLPLDNGVQVNGISWQLDDYGGTALSSTALPTTAPVLSDWDWQSIGIGGGIGGTPPCYTYSFGISANVTSAVLIPEPISLVLLGIGILALRKHK
jgi:hypothetical protein